MLGVSSQDVAEFSNILHSLPLFSHRVRLHQSQEEIAHCGYVKVSIYQVFFPWFQLVVNKPGTVDAPKTLTAIFTKPNHPCMNNLNLQYVLIPLVKNN